MKHSLGPQPRWGASFSAKYCRELGVDPTDTLRAGLELGIRRLRLMSYWNECENVRGIYDFEELDAQMNLAGSYGAKVSLCIGKRQPRWPECHAPEWALKLETHERRQALYAFVEVTARRYRGHPALESWQLENEAMLKSFGHCEDGDYSRTRLGIELAIVRKTDPKHPVIMTLSDNWSFPVRGPRPDMYAFSVYIRVLDRKGRHVGTIFPWWWHRLRASIIQALTGTFVFLHELQAEPWGDRPLANMSDEAQDETMNPERFEYNIAFASKVHRHPTYLWGLEWWYWRKVVRGDDAMWRAAEKVWQKDA